MVSAEVNIQIYVELLYSSTFRKVNILASVCSSAVCVLSSMGVTGALF